MFIVWIHRINEMIAACFHTAAAAAAAEKQRVCAKCDQIVILKKKRLAISMVIAVLIIKVNTVSMVLIMHKCREEQIH